MPHLKPSQRYPKYLIIIFIIKIFFLFIQEKKKQNI